MKIVFILILILITPIFGQSQINQSIDFISGYEYSYRSLQTASEDTIVSHILENRDNGQGGKFNWRLGLNYNLRLSSNIFIKTGLRMATSGYKDEKQTELRWGSEINEMGGWTPDPDLPREVQLIYNYWFTEIPIVGRYEMKHKKFTPFLELGISPSIYMTTQVKTITDKGRDSDFLTGFANNFRRLHVLASISVGLNYSLSDKFQLFGQPIFRYHLTKLADTPISEHLFNYGIEVGIRRRIR